MQDFVAHPPSAELARLEDRYMVDVLAHMFTTGARDPLMNSVFDRMNKIRTKHAVIVKQMKEGRAGPLA